MHILKIHKDGLIRGGHVKYKIHPDGLVYYEASVVVKLGFWKKRHNFSGTYALNPAYVLSDYYSSKKKTVKIEGVELSVPSKGLAKCRYEDADVEVLIECDLNQELVQIVSVKGKGSALGISINVKASRP